jgi:DNA polymerase V
MKNQKLALKFGKILSEIRQLRNLSQEQLAHESDLDRTYISQLERGKKMPTIQTLFSLSQSLNVSPADLIAKISGRTPIVDKLALQEATVHFPIYATGVSCGSPITQDHRIEEILSLDDLLVKNPAHTFFIKANGDSMSPRIMDGDYLVVDIKIPPTSGQVILAQLNNEFTIKRFIQHVDKVELVSDNSLYADIIVSESQDLIICGVVVAVISLSL